MGERNRKCQAGHTAENGNEVETVVAREQEDPTASGELAAAKVGGGGSGLGPGLLHRPQAPPLRSRFRAPLECCVTVRESILSVCTLPGSLDTTTLCHWLSLTGLSEFPFIKDGPFPRSNT